MISAFCFYLNMLELDTHALDYCSPEISEKYIRKVCKICEGSMLCKY